MKLCKSYITFVPCENFGALYFLGFVWFEKSLSTHPFLWNLRLYFFLHLLCRAESDRKRYQQEMENYTPPERDGENKKRSKTGYNMFFSAYVLQLKQSAAGVPPERGSVARLVGNAWKVGYPFEILTSNHSCSLLFFFLGHSI